MRLHKPWNVPIHMPRVDTGSMVDRRVSISLAALLVNVTASTALGGTRRAVRARWRQLVRLARVKAPDGPGDLAVLILQHVGASPMEDADLARPDIDGVCIAGRSAGSGPPVLLLHGDPQTRGATDAG